MTLKPLPVVAAPLPLSDVPVEVIRPRRRRVGWLTWPFRALWWVVCIPWRDMQKETQEQREWRQEW